MLLRHCVSIYFVFASLGHLPHIGSSRQVSKCKNCTTLLPRVDVFKRHVISRRKRVVLFPKKAFLLLSQAFTKAIIDGRPPGLAYSIEFDMYSTLPDTVEAWKPTILNDKLKSEQKSKSEKQGTSAPTPEPLQMPSKLSNADGENIDEMLPGFTIADDADEFDGHIWPAENEYQTDNVMLSSSYWHPLHNVTDNRRHFLYAKNMQKDILRMKHLYKMHTWNYSNKRRTKTRLTEESPYTAKNINQWPPMADIYESEEDVPAWKYHQAYRERRDLFEQLHTLGKIFNFDMKSCIQRAMCEMRNNLRPFGESLMEDIVRIILTIPKKLNFNDDYLFDFTQNTNEKLLRCDKQFKRSCPYKVLDFLTATLRTAKLVDH